jgi:predicted permease
MAELSGGLWTQRLDRLRQDVRYALRGLRRSPGFTAAVVLTLGLGIGVNAAMFNIIDELMLRPPAYLRDPGGVHRVYLRIPGSQRLLTRESFPYARYLDLRSGTTSFSDYAAFFPTTLAVGVGEAARERPVTAVSASFFDFFDARPVLGRFFIAAEDTTPTGAKVAVLAYDFWNAELGGRDVIGESIQAGNVVYTIVGVAPEGFSGVADGRAPAIFVPITTFGANQPGGSSVDYWRRYTWDWTEMMVRRKPGVTLAQANADLTTAYIRSRDAARAIHSWMPRTDAARPVAIAGALKTAAGPYPGLEARTLLWVTGVAAIVLLIACANVANLLLARALARRREIAVRLALGVTRRMLAAQALIESLGLALLGCIAGIAIAQWGGLALRRLVLPDAAALDLATDWRTLAAAVTAALVAGLLTGLAPAVLAGRGDLATTLKSGGRGATSRRSRLRSTLLVSQCALSVALLVGAGLFVRSLEHVRELHLGYDVNPALMVRWDRRGAQMDHAERAMLRRRLLDVARGIPGVEHAAWASNVPLQGTSTMALYVPGIDSVGRLGRFTYQTAGVDYFRVMGTRVLRGRGFTSADRVGAPGVVIVSDAMARVLWPGQDPVGQCIRVGADSMPCSTVVGVAEDAVHDPVRDQPLRYYLPLDQVPSEGASLLVLRMRQDPAPLAETVRRALQAVMPGQQYVTVQPMASLLDEQRRSWRVGAAMFVAFGILALLVAAVGLYGVIAYDVAQRMHELGVRVALGAQGLDILRLVIGRGLRLAVLGVAVGSALAFAATSWIQPLLFQQSARDPAVFGLVGAVLLVVALLATSVPAARATRADPNTVLRAE